MFQSLKNSNAYHHTEREFGGRKKTHKKTHNPPKRKSHSKHVRTKKEKKWRANLDNPHIKHSRYASDCIGPERLTKHMGFLTKGKMSDSISRLEKIVPGKLKARAEKDLHKVLKSDNNSKDNYTTERMLVDNQNAISSGEESSSSSVAKSPAAMQHFVCDKVQNDSAHLSTGKSIFSSGESLEDESQTDNEEISICQEIITNKLHTAVLTASQRFFPGVSYQNKVRNELLSIKNQHILSRKELSNSSNWESSQDTCNSGRTDDLPKDNFKLHPVLTQDTSAPRDLEDMFPSSQDLSFESEDEVYTNPPPLSQSRYSSDRNFMNSKPSTFSSEKEDCVTLISASPLSPSGSPVWVTDVSPLKFIPDYLPTPKLYFRQKMF